jgi:drug/metabolite transporter (DMT)-like permease
LSRRPIAASPLWPGAAYAFGSAFLFGAGTPASKVLVERIDPWLMAGFLYGGAGIGLGVLFLIRRLIRGGAPTEARLTGRAWLWFLAAALTGGGIAPALLMAGLARTPGSTGSLLLNLEVVLTVLIAGAIFREQIGRRVALGVVAIVAGGIVLAWRGDAGAASLLGPLAIAGACLGWALDNNFSRKIALCDPLQVAALRGLLAGPLNIGLAFGFGAAVPAAGDAVAAGALGLGSYGLPLVFFVLSLRSLGAARTGAFFATAPFIGAVISVVALNEPIDAQLLTAGALMAAGAYLGFTERHEHEHEHDALSHSHRHQHDDHHQHEHGPLDPPGEPHVHHHVHAPLSHSHAHAPDEHHRHGH